MEHQGATVTTTVDGKTELTGLIRDARCKSVDINSLCLARGEHWFKEICSLDFFTAYGYFQTESSGGFLRDCQGLSHGLDPCLSGGMRTFPPVPGAVGPGYLRAGSDTEISDIRRSEIVV